MIDAKYDVKKINSLSGCGECVFCLTKCPICLTADVRVDYQRMYKKNGDVDSMALIACKCGRTLLEEHPLPEGIVVGTETLKMYRQQYYEVQKLTEIFDKYFENINPKEPADVQFLYELHNENEDELTLIFEDIENYVEFEDELPTEIRLEFNNDDRIIRRYHIN